MKMIDKIAEQQADCQARYNEALRAPKCGCDNDWCEHRQLRHAKVGALEAEMDALARIALEVKHFAPNMEYEEIVIPHE